LGAGRIALFGMAAVGALALGIGAAEMQERFFSSSQEPSMSERAAAAQTSAPETAEQERTANLVREMNGAFRRSRNDIVKDIREDCLYRHPGRDNWSIRDACVRRQTSLLDKMKEMWGSTSVPNARAIVMICMDRSRTLHGFDWQDVSWCFERTAVEVRRGT